jgi:hypothetical protein
LVQEFQEDLRYIEEAAQEMREFFSSGGIVGIYNALNHTKMKRKIIAEKVAMAIPECQILWIESVLTDQEILESNLRSIKLSEN